ncbi:MAG: hypothetical protein AMQ22_00088 [Candidatus Methanofastidiosum methylothiophilum]|uniref:Uncharacterized protein n=1 Tax=Candidatus Methanofastidiosum methylothiophilum TaxID=1705564 RepID=A0A150J9Y4_9EURY|nr:MAG: hypothetical protein AMQ22_00088 [Candidatus Methanofastidiosum methylthiophilus]
MEGDGDCNNSNCIHEKDFLKLSRSVKGIKGELKKGSNLFTFLTEELEIVKDALGVKSKENGERDKQLQEIRAKAHEIGEKAEAEDKSIRQLLTEVMVEIAEIKGALGLNQKKRELKDSIKLILIGAAMGAVFTIFIEAIKVYTTFI